MFAGTPAAPSEVEGRRDDRGGRAGSTRRACRIDADAALLRKLGYEQELKRGLAAFDNVAIGFATISPVVAFYSVVLVGTVVAGRVAERLRGR